MNIVFDAITDMSSLEKRNKRYKTHPLRTKLLLLYAAYFRVRTLNTQAPIWKSTTVSGAKIFNLQYASMIIDILFSFGLIRKMHYGAASIVLMLSTYVNPNMNVRESHLVK